MTGYTIRKNMQTSLVTFMVVTTLSRHIHQHYRIRAESLVHLVLPCTIFICASLCKEDQLLKKKKRPSSPSPALPFPPTPPPPPPLSFQGAISVFISRPYFERVASTVEATRKSQNLFIRSKWWRNIEVHLST